MKGLNISTCAKKRDRCHSSLKLLFVLLTGISCFSCLQEYEYPKDLERNGDYRYLFFCGAHYHPDSNIMTFSGFVHDLTVDTNDSLEANWVFGYKRLRGYTFKLINIDTQDTIHLERTPAGWFEPITIYAGEYMITIEKSGKTYKIFPIEVNAYVNNRSFEFKPIVNSQNDTDYQVSFVTYKDSVVLLKESVPTTPSSGFYNPLSSSSGSRLFFEKKGKQTFLLSKLVGWPTFFNGEKVSLKLEFLKNSRFYIGLKALPASQFFRQESIREYANESINPFVIPQNYPVERAVKDMIVEINQAQFVY